MPLPWKKTKVSRISKFMADLHHSPKHGGSLVVETGFPTSLIDLFVKNRDRLKKRSNRKLSMSSPVSLSPQPNMERSVVREPEGDQEVYIDDVEVISNCKFSDPVTKEVDIVNLDRVDSNERRRSEGNQKIFIAVEILALVVVAMSTKKVTVAITLFAFVLLLVEYTAARVSRFSKPFPDFWNWLDYLIGSEKALIDEEECEIISIDEEECEIISIEMDETKEFEMKCVSEPFRIRDCLENEETNRNLNLKSKITMKFIPKRFRKPEKAGKTVDERKSSCLDDEKVEKEDVASTLVESIEKKSSFKLHESKSNPNPNPIQVDFKNNNETGIEANAKSSYGYLVLLLVFIAGVAGGRVLAIVLTVVWLLMFRFIGNMKTTTNVV